MRLSVPKARDVGRHLLMPGKRIFRDDGLGHRVNSFQAKLDWLSAKGHRAGAASGVCGVQRCNERRRPFRPERGRGTVQPWLKSIATGYSKAISPDRQPETDRLGFGIATSFGACLRRSRKHRLSSPTFSSRTLSPFKVREISFGWLITFSSRQIRPNLINDADRGLFYRCTQPEMALHAALPSLMLVAASHRTRSTISPKRSTS